MATVRTTIYRCDICGEKQEKRADLVQIRVEKGTRSYNYRTGSYNLNGVKADFCLPCENNFIDAVGVFYGSTESASELSRPEPKPKKVKDGRADTTVKA